MFLAVALMLLASQGAVASEGVLLLEASPAVAEDGASGGSELSAFDVEWAIEYALEHNPTYLRTALASEMAGFDFVYNASIFEPTFSAKLDASHTRTGGLSYESQVISGTDSKKLEGQVALSKLLPAGDTFSLSFGNTRSEYASGLLSETEQNIRTYTSALGLTYNRPLLKGFGSAVTMAGIEKAELDKAISEKSMDAARAELIYTVRVAYFYVVAAKEAVGVAEASLAQAESLLAQTKAMVAAGSLAPYEEIAAQAGLYSREEEVIVAKGDYSKALNHLKEVIGYDFADELDLGGELSISGPNIDIETAVDDALQSRPEIEQLKLERTKAEVDLFTARNSTRPELGFNGGFGFQGEDFDLGGSFDGMDNFSWFAGLSYVIPLGGNNGAGARMEIARLSIEDIDLRLESLEDSIEREVLDAVVEYQNSFERLHVTGAGLEAAAVKMESEKKRFELGLITAGDLLEYEKEYTQAQYAFLNAKIGHLNAIALLAKLTHAG